MFYKFLRLFIVITLSICFSFLTYLFLIRKFVYPLKYKEIVLEYADKYNLDEKLIFSIIKVESGFNKKAKSEKGAYGLMQLKEETAKYIANKNDINEFDLYNEDDNINLGCAYFRYLLDKFNNINTSIVAYNAGEGNVKLWLQNEKYSLDGITLQNIPYKESEEYLEKTLKTFEKYSKLYGDIVDK